MKGVGVLPCGPEADVGYGDTAENEERRETRQGQEPIKDVTTSTSIQIDKCQTPKEKLKEGDDKGTALPIDIGE